MIGVDRLTSGGSRSSLISRVAVTLIIGHADDLAHAAVWLIALRRMTWVGQDATAIRHFKVVYVAGTINIGGSIARGVDLTIVALGICGARIGVTRTSGQWHTISISVWSIAIIAQTDRDTIDLVTLTTIGLDASIRKATRSLGDGRAQQLARPMCLGCTFTRFFFILD
jgi:hypothetical protein